MKPLHESSCAPYDEKPMHMDEEKINDYMRRVAGWKLENDRIIKEYLFKNDEQALDFVSKTGKLAIKEGHHPITTWNFDKVKVTFHTHAVRGLTRNDFIMAAKFDEIFKAKK